MGHMMDTDLDPTQMLEVRVILFLMICTSLSFFFLQVGSYHDEESMFTESSDAIKT